MLSDLLLMKKKIDVVNNWTWAFEECIIWSNFAS